MEFKGIKQVLESTYTGMSAEQKAGYIWFVRESTASTQGKVYLGSRCYGSSEEVDVPTTVAELTDSSNYLTTSAASETYQPILSAGTNVTIQGNTISAEGGSPILESAITVGNQVGYLSTGMTYSAGTSIEQILRDMLIDTRETLNITLIASGAGSNNADVQGATITVTYGGESHGYSAGMKIPAGTEYVVSAGAVTNYATPVSQSFTATTNGVRNVTFEYVYSAQPSSDVYGYYGTLDEDNLLIDDALATELEYDEVYPEEEFTATNIKSKLTTSSSPIENGSVITFSQVANAIEVLVVIPATFSAAIKNASNSDEDITNAFTIVNVEIDGIAYKAYRWFFDGGFGSATFKIIVTNS